MYGDHPPSDPFGRITRLLALGRPARWAGSHRAHGVWGTTVVLSNRMNWSAALGRTLCEEQTRRANGRRYNMIRFRARQAGQLGRARGGHVLAAFGASALQGERLRPPRFCAACRCGDDVRLALAGCSLFGSSPSATPTPSRQRSLASPPSPIAGLLPPAPTNCPPSPALSSITAQPSDFSHPTTPLYGESPVWIPHGYMPLPRPRPLPHKVPRLPTRP